MSRKKEEAIASGVKIAETKHNMKRRKPWHDYRRKGTYMLTLVVEGRQPLLGKVVTMPAAGAAVTTSCASAMGGLSAHVELTELGKTIRDEEAMKITTVYQMVKVWKLCIMPDHIHMIVRVTEDMPDKAAVIVHNAYTDAEYAEYKRRWLAFGEAGGILVSAAIASREKDVMREATDRVPL